MVGRKEQIAVAVILSLSRGQYLLQETRDERVGQWKNFVAKKEKQQKSTKLKGTFKPPKPKLEKR